MPLQKAAVLLRKKVAEQEKEAYETTANNLESLLIDLVKDSNTPVTEFTIAPITKLVDSLRAEEPPWESCDHLIFGIKD